MATDRENAVILPCDRRDTLEPPTHSRTGSESASGPRAASDQRRTVQEGHGRPDRSYCLSMSMSSWRCHPARRRPSRCGGPASRQILQAARASGAVVGEAGGARGPSFTHSVHDARRTEL